MPVCRECGHEMTEVDIGVMDKWLQDLKKILRPEEGK